MSQNFLSIFRAFFIAIFRHIHYIGARACHRTALEFCKLALSLDPLEDPLGILLMMDFYAIRSQQYSWFLEFLTSWDPKRNLTQLPNMAYSMALAQFYSSKNQDFAMADHSIQKALIEFPGVFLPLMDKCSVEIVKFLPNSVTTANFNVPFVNTTFASFFFREELETCNL